MVSQASATQLSEAKPFFMDLHLLWPSIMTYASSQPSDYSFLFYFMESKEKVYCFNSQPYALRTIQSTGTCFVSKDFQFNQSMLFEGPNMRVINL